MREEGGDYVAVPGAKLVFSRERIGKHHIWVDPYVVAAEYFYASDAFGEAAVAEGITGLDVSLRNEA